VNDLKRLHLDVVQLTSVVSLQCRGESAARRVCFYFCCTWCDI